jgi:nucleoid DNA-binding protein
MSLKDLPEAVQKHLISLIASAELPDTEEFRERMAAAWTKKCRLFEQQSRFIEMELTDSLPKSDKRGALVLTWSGSIIAIGPDTGSREAEYASMEIRSDVPNSVQNNGTALAEDVARNKPVCFTEGQLQKTSPAFMIAVFPAGVSADTQQERLREAMIFLTNSFVKINQTVHIDKKNIPDQFTAKAMVRYLAKRHELTTAQAQKILDDYHFMLEAGMLLGENVPVGKIGKLTMKTREAQKARVVRHPETGEEFTVKAKPSVSVPKVSFSKRLKEKAAALPVEGD